MAEEKKVKFVSRYKAYRLILKPENHITHENGEVSHYYGQKAEFTNGEFLADEDMAKAMRKNPRYNVDFYEDTPGIAQKDEVVITKGVKGYGDASGKSKVRTSDEMVKDI